MTLIGIGTSWDDSSRLRDVTMTSLMAPSLSDASDAGADADESAATAPGADESAAAATTMFAGFVGARTGGDASGALSDEDAHARLAPPRIAIPKTPQGATRRADLEFISAQFNN